MIRYDPGTGTFCLQLGTPEELLELDSKLERVSADEERWYAPGQTFVRQAVSFLASVTSGKASPEVVEERRRSCFAPCPALRTEGARHFCGACGCGTAERAELGTKLGYAHVVCPLRRPGFSNAS